MLSGKTQAAACGFAHTAENTRNNERWKEEPPSAAVEADFPRRQDPDSLTVRLGKPGGAVLVGAPLIEGDLHVELLLFLLSTIAWPGNLKHHGIARLSSRDAVG